MSRRLLVAGNWKMNLDRAGAVLLARQVADRAAPLAARIDLAVCPPHVYLDAVRGALGNAPVALGAQNLYFETSGAFTGEISAAMLLDLGCRYVILGHSERRHVLGETDDFVHRKLLAALAAESAGKRLTPIVCVGELLAERESGQTAAVIGRQFETAFADVSGADASRVVIAYEPVWAIGTGRVATPAQAEEVHGDLRRLLASRYNDGLAAGVRILYGGSVKADNAAQLLAQPNVDGALVGGASLKVDDFLGIAAGAVEVSSAKA